MRRVHNFNAGPGILPIPVLEATQMAVTDFNGIGMSIMEISHRSKEFDAVIKDAQANVLSLMGLDSNEYAALFLQGGANTQFAMIPMNFMHNKVDYVNTGVWSTKALKEAQFLATEGQKVNEIASSKDENFSYIPKDVTYNSDSDYTHITTNNTIYGSEWRALPDTNGSPLVVDMSSDIFAQVVDFKKAHLIYAGAQKNMGPAGVTLVVVRRDWVEQKQKETAPTMLRYSTHVKEESLFNTPPCLPIYVVNETLKWIINTGGLAVREEINKKKAALIYNVIDTYNDFYKGVIKHAENRSLMNITFRLPSEELESKFVKEAEKLEMVGLKGHRSAGGIRASTYNACPVESCEALAQFMEQFQKENR
jgi:phosphoserine aminotransferase